MIMDNRVLSLKVLCFYIKSVCGINNQFLYEEFAYYITTKQHKQVSSKTVENIISEGQNFFTFEQSCIVAKKCASLMKNKDKIGILNYLLESFLKACSPNDAVDVTKLVRKYTGVEEPENLPAKNRAPQQLSSENSKIASTKKSSSDVQKPILNDVAQEIKTTIKEKFVFLYGPDQSGKNFLSKSVIKEFYDEGNIDYQICLDYEYDKMTYPTFLKKVIQAVCGDTRYLSITEIPELKRKAAKCLSCSRRYSIFVNGIEKLSDNDRYNLISFIANNVFYNSIVIIASNEVKDAFPEISSAFKEIHMRPLTWSEWENYVALQRKDTPLLQRLDEVTYKKIVNLAFLYGKGYLGLLKRYLFNFCDLVATQDFLDDYDFNVQASIIYYTEEFKNLSDETLKVLIAISLFNCISKKGLVEITGLSESVLSENLDFLQNMSFIKKQSQSTITQYSLTKKLTFAVESERNNNPEKYKKIYDSWILYYIKLTAKYDISFANFDNLCCTMPELDSILYAIEYCAEHGRKKDYISLVQNWFRQSKAS